MPLISVVVPCRNEEESLPLFFAELCAVANGMHGRDEDVCFEAVFVDDGSTDGTLGVVEALEAPDPSMLAVRWLSFSRNFGKEAAIFAGFEEARGDYVCTMDADLQDPPSLLPAMYAVLVDEGFDSVATRRVNREGEPPVRSFCARQFYRIINRISDVDVVDGARDYRLMTRRVVDGILSLKEYNRFSKGIYGWVGFKTKWLPYENVQRAAGETKWNFFSLFRYSLDGIVGFSTAPLSIASLAGLLSCLLAFVFVVVIVVRALLFGDPVAGWPSLACIVLFMGGLNLLCLGIIGQYLAKAYLETKRRPLYLVRRRSDD
ncbi:glycosyltransferase family 2 protein [Xiamenia xianingshaonis]|uniref:Glycosyltransferase n=1 Tax=Xiamenia xianingshaonis TaxID=2682776 RepID=A0A9E6MPX3_9ACTN|nr:glycosyltransferase family 2 protein [Xiamenia xianingshaonis]NHM14530.1 glycosyltransferase [Xiamenia xianingshaonis]QTU83817.1 glycosyltransferase family 2 protein [Xiamenia xianingshaonis]